MSKESGKEFRRRVRATWKAFDQMRRHGFGPLGESPEPHAVDNTKPTEGNIREALAGNDLPSDIGHQILDRASSRDVRKVRAQILADSQRDLI